MLKPSTRHAPSVVMRNIHGDVQRVRLRFTWSVIQRPSPVAGRRHGDSAKSKTLKKMTTGSADSSRTPSCVRSRTTSTIPRDAVTARDGVRRMYSGQTEERALRGALPAARGGEIANASPHTGAARWRSPKRVSGQQKLAPPAAYRFTAADVIWKTVPSAPSTSGPKSKAQQPSGRPADRRLRA